ncbi:hypothetical protein DXG01_012541, partial [Tephrocybe rancida]
NFEASASESDGSEPDVVIDNEELAHSLPTKTKLLTASKKRKRKAASRHKKPKPTTCEYVSESESRPVQKQRVTMEVVDDEDMPSQTQTRKFISSTISSSMVPTAVAID